MSHPLTDGFYQSDPPFPVVETVDERDGSIIVDRAALSKITRELPNLSECHSCGYRSNNDQDKLRTLNSEWRIVLLCRKCYRRAVHGEVCTYCFYDVAEMEIIFKCGKCFSRVHKDCMSKFSEFPPWSYFDWRSSSVCLDCWLPAASKVQKQVRGGKRSIVNNFVTSRRKKGGEKDVDNNAVEKRAQLVENPQMTFRSRENSFPKALFAKAGIGKENGGSSLPVSGELDQKRKRVDDAELAFQLHLVMNSSPRISRKPQTSISCHEKIVKRRRAGGNLRTSAFGQSNCVIGEGFNASVNKGFDTKDERAMKEGQGSCSNNSMTDSETFSWKDLDLAKPELKFTYGRRKFSSNFDGRPSRYMFKYSRKRSRLIELVARKYTYLYDRSSYESETSSTTIVLPSSDEPRKFPDACHFLCVQMDHHKTMFKEGDKLGCKWEAESV